MCGYPWLTFSSRYILSLPWPHCAKFWEFLSRLPAANFHENHLQRTEADWIVFHHKLPSLQVPHCHQHSPLAWWPASKSGIFAGTGRWKPCTLSFHLLIKLSKSRMTDKNGGVQMVIHIVTSKRWDYVTMRKVWSLTLSLFHSPGGEALCFLRLSNTFNLFKTFPKFGFNNASHVLLSNCFKTHPMKLHNNMLLTTWFSGQLPASICIDHSFQITLAFFCFSCILILFSSKWSSLHYHAPVRHSRQKITVQSTRWHSITVITNRSLLSMLSLD